MKINLLIILNNSRMTRVNESLSRFIFFISFLLFSLINQAQNTVTICNGDSAFIYNNWVTQNGVYTDGITSTTLIVNPTPTLTGSFILNGNAIQPIPDTYQLTPAINTQSGSAWNSVTLNLTQPFSFDVDIFFGYNNGGADGIAFLLQQVNTNVGTGGGGMGYAGITPSLCVEFDTWNNGSLYSDPSYDHIAVQKNGDLNHIGPNNLVSPIGFPPANVNIEDGLWHNVIFSWNPTTNNFRVVFDGNLLINYTDNIIANIFGNNPNVYWGFTAATGGANNLQQFRVNSLGVQLYDTTICSEDTIQIDPQINTSAYTYLWTPNYNITNNTLSTTLFSPDTTTVYSLEVTNSYGCPFKDSLTIFVNTPTSNTTSIAECDSYTWLVNNQTYSTSGTYTHVSTNAAGCTHSEILELVINTPTSNSNTVIECDSYTWTINGNTYISSGIYTNISTNNSGCTHVDSLLLIINNSSTSAVADTACGEYIWQGLTYNNSGNYTDTLTGYNGCDSIVNLALIIFEDSSVSYITDCDSTQWNGVWYYNDTTVTNTGFLTTNSFGSSSTPSNSKEGNIWYFGVNAGIDFNSGTPISITDGQLNTLEGCASIADNNGDLLFYTDGSLVYNRNHTIMPNGTGLFGNNSSSQSAIIVKKPLATNIYYIFTVGATAAIEGIHYSEVDMNLQGGLGNINTNKNISITTDANEKITAIKHQNGSDFWIICRLKNSNSYHAYLLTATGLNMTPIITNIGPNYIDPIGYMKGSPDGSKIAVANHSSATESVDILDFDNQTGILSNPITINQGCCLYGIEFSPNNDILYFSDYNCIYQVNLLAGSPNNIINSVSNIGCPGTSQAMALQLAPDEKIYFAKLNNNNIGAINNPNILGSGCNYTANAVSLTSGLSNMGLPTFYSSIFSSPPSGCDSVATAIIDIKNSSSTYTNIIECDSFTWVLNGQTYYVSQIDTIHSINADGCTHIDSLDLRINLSSTGTSTITTCDNYIWDGVIYTATGIYTNNYNNILGCDSIHTLNLTVNSSTSDTIIDIACDSYTWLLNGNIYDSSGTYIEISTNNVGCDHTETLVLVIGHTDDLNLLIDKNDIECFGYDNGSIGLNASGGAPPYQFSWINNSYTSQSIISLSSGNYGFTITDTNGCQLDSFAIINEPDEIFLDNFLATSPICRYDKSTLSYNISNAIYNSYTISVLDSIVKTFVIDTNGLLVPEGIPITLTPNFSGKVKIISLTDPAGCTQIFNDSVHIEVKQLPQLAINEDTLCYGEASYTLNNATPLGGTYYINNIMTNYFDVENLESGNYNLTYEYTDPLTLCYNEITEIVTISDAPKAGMTFSPQPTNIDNPDILFSDNSSEEVLTSEWNLGDGTIIYNTASFWHTYTDTGTYTIRYYITNMYGCTDSITNKVTINPIYSIFIPTAFTPNDDGNNDYFYPSVIGGDRYNMKIYNRWGGIIYNQDNDKWNGKISDNTITNGIYPYSISVFDFNDRLFIYNGIVNLIK